MICRECGSDMKPKTVQKGKNYKPKIVRFECSCGYMESSERTMEKFENDMIEQETKQFRKREIGNQYL